MKLSQTQRTTLGRNPDRGSYDRQELNAILDEAMLCHAGFAVDGVPFVMPMVFARLGDTLYLHGSSKGRIAEALARGLSVCVTVTLLDGLVLARSGFHHSANYRSAVLFGLPRIVEELPEKHRALDAFVNHLVKGRAQQLRPPSQGELQATHVLAFAIDEASIKTRQGPPADSPADVREATCWAGEVPLRMHALEPISAPDLRAGTHTPESITKFHR